MERMLSRAYKSRTFSKRDLGAAIGSVIHVGLDCFHETDSLDWAHNAMWWATRAYPLGSGYNWNDYDRCLREALTAYVKKQPFTPATVLGGECRFGEDYGNAEIDTQLWINGFTFADFKTKTELDTKYEQDFWLEQQDDWSYRHYVWMCQQEWKCVINQFAVCLIVLAPRPRIVVKWFPVDQRVIAAWYRSAVDTWDAMYRDEVHYTNETPLLVWPRRSNNHYRGQYKTRCDYYEACHTYLDSRGNPDFNQLGGVYGPAVRNVPVLDGA